MTAEDAIAALAEDLLFLKQQFYLQTAEVRALRQFLLEISSPENHQAAVDALAKLTMQHYDRLILKMGDEHPAVAEAIDIRRKLPPEERERWYSCDDL